MGFLADLQQTHSVLGKGAVKMHSIYGLTDPRDKMGAL
jgi:hypothetical protein